MKIVPILGCIVAVVVLGETMSRILPDGTPLWLGVIVAFGLAMLVNGAVIIVRRNMGSKESSDGEPPSA